MNLYCCKIKYDEEIETLLINNAYNKFKYIINEENKNIYIILTSKNKQISGINRMIKRLFHNNIEIIKTNNIKKTLNIYLKEFDDKKYLFLYEFNNSRKVIRQEILRLETVVDRISNYAVDNNLQFNMNTIESDVKNIIIHMIQINNINPILIIDKLNNICEIIKIQNSEFIFKK